MTVSNTQAREIYACNGVTTVRTVPFRVLDETHLRVVKYTIATGAVVDLVLNTDFTVTNIGAANATMTTMGAGSPVSSAYKLIALRSVPFSQAEDYVANDAFPAESHEEALDKITMILQQLDDVNTRAAVLPEFAPATLAVILPIPADGYGLVWDDDVGTLRNTTVSMETLETQAAALYAIAANITTVAGISANVTTVAGISSAVSTVAGIASYVSAVGAIAGAVSTVAGITANIATVAGISANVTTVAGVATSISTVAGLTTEISGVYAIRTDVSGVYTIRANVTTVAGISGNVTTVAGISANIATVAGISANVTTVAGVATSVSALGPISANITTVAGISAAVSTVSGISSAVSTVSSIQAYVTTVSGIQANVTTVAGISGNVTTVAGVSANVTTVAGISANVTTVAGVSADVTTCASNITSIQGASANAAAAAASATLSAAAAGFGYKYSTNTASSDPTSGYLKFNNATLASATALYISETTNDSQAVAAILATLDDSTSTIHTKLRLFKQSDPTTFAIFNITGTITDNGTWDTFTVAYVGGSGSLSNNDVLSVQFLLTGDKGDTGTTGATGAAGSVPVADAGGTVDAITADFTPDLTLADKTICVVIAAGANTVTTPSFAPDGLTARTIVKQGGLALLVGDIRAAGHALILEYNLANTRWELLNPAFTQLIGASESSDTTCFPVFVNAASGTAQTPKYNSNLGYNASTNQLTVAIVTGLSTPVNASDAASKSYVDSVALGLDAKAPCKVATTANLNATYLAGVLTNAGALAALSIDGVSLATNDRVLVKNQSTGLQNGWYSVTTVGSGAVAWVMTRTSDADGAGEIVEGDYTIITEGTVNTGSLWIVTTTGTITIGTDAIAFTQLVVSAAGNATTVTVSDAASDTTTWPMLATSQTGNLGPATDAGLTYNASTDTLTTTALALNAATNQIVLDADGTYTGTLTMAALSASKTWTLPNSTGTLMTLSGSGTVASKTFDNSNTYQVKDTLFTMQDDGDATKLAAFECSGISTGTTRTFTFPNVTGTLALTSNATDTFGALTDITTNNASTSAHGFLKKLDNTATNYMDGTGAWSVPAGTAGGLTTISSGSFSAATTQDFTGIAATYRALVLYWSVASNATASRAFQVTSNCGAGLGSENHLWQSFLSDSGGVATTGGGQLTGAIMGNTQAQAAAETTTGVLIIHSYQSGPFKPYTMIARDSTGGTPMSKVTNGMILATGALQGLRCYWSGSGNFDAGTYALYGVN